MPRTSIAIALLSVLSSAAGAQQPPALADPAVDAAMRNREYEKAVTLIDAAIRETRPAGKEILHYQRGLALLYAGKHEAAAAAFDTQLAEFSAGPWASKAAFRKVEALIALKKFDQAEAIYAERVRSLTSEQRKDRLARIYVDFAAEYFEPKDKFVAANFEKARSFYEKAIELQPGPALRDECMLQRAVCTQKLQQWPDAAGQYEHYLLVFDAAFRDAARARSPRAAQPAFLPTPGKHTRAARLNLAECQLQAGRHGDARRTAQDLLALDAAAPRSDGAGTRADPAMTVEAEFLIARTYQMPAPPSDETLQLGVEAYNRVIADFPASKQAVRAAFEVAVAQAARGHADAALGAYKRFIDREQIRPGDDETRKLAEELSQRAVFNTGELLFGQKKYADAIGSWNQYVAKYPSGPHWSASQQRIVDAEYQIAIDAVTEKKYGAAREAWDAFLQKHPLDNRAAAIMFWYGDLSYQEGKWADAIAHWKRLVTKFPGTEEAGHGQYMIGATLEDKTGELEAALEAYKAVTWSSYAAYAQQRIAAMNETRLLVHTDRIYRTDEPAMVRVDTRNVDRVQVKMYRIDMLDYFRKKHTLGGVESLDLVLIDPDKTYTVDLAGHARYKPLTQEIEVPFDGPGVWAVNVSNDVPAGGRRDQGIEGSRDQGTEAEGDQGGSPKTDRGIEGSREGGVGAGGTGEAGDGDNPKSKIQNPKSPPGPKLEATTLLVRSDIDIITKSSRRQMLVFAQNMRTGQPAAGVSVLVSDGAKIKLEGKTGADGVWLAKSDDLKSLENLAILASLADADIRTHHASGGSAAPDARSPAGDAIRTPHASDGPAASAAAIHVAGNALALSGLEFSTGLSPRGYIYTDKPTYRPGEAVNITGILREVKDGQYSLPTQADDPRLRWKMDVVDAKGRVLRTQEVWEESKNAERRMQKDGERGAAAGGDDKTADTAPAPAIQNPKSKIQNDPSKTDAESSRSASPYGTFAAQFRIADDAPVGAYKIIVRRADGPTFTGSFNVEEYQLSKAFLKFDFDQPFVMRGEKIKGAIVAKYHYGEPVVGKTVEYALHDPWTGESVNQTAETDKDGRIAFEFDTTTMPEEATVMFTARQADLGVEGAGTVFVAVRAFRAAVSTARPLFLADEPFDVTVETKDLKGEPTAQDMTLTAYLRTYSAVRGGGQSEPGAEATGLGQSGALQTLDNAPAAQQAVQRSIAPGRWSETKVESVALKTDAKTGKGRATLKLTKGGSYVLRAEGKDRFSHVVSAETLVSISGDDDDTRLHVFSERQNYKVGETVSLDIHSRVPSELKEGLTKDPPRIPLALITFEGEEIIGYRTLPLAVGHNPINLPLGNEHFPNFSVGVSVMERRTGKFDANKPAARAFHTASRDFTVERQLNIEIRPVAAGGPPAVGDQKIKGARDQGTKGSRDQGQSKIENQKSKIDGDATAAATVPTFRPRDEMSVELTVTDHQGKPVAAEIGLLMIDNAVLSQFPDATPDIVAFFQEGALRRAAMRTETSCDFRYTAQTRAMITEILAEAERVAEKDAEAARRVAAVPPAPVEAVPQARLLERLGYAGERDDKPADAVVRTTSKKYKLPSGGARQAGRGAINEGGLRGGGGGQLFQERAAEEGDKVLDLISMDDEGDGNGVADAGFRFFFDQTGARDSSVVVGKRLALVQDAARAGQLRVQLGETLGLDATLNKALRDAPPRTYFPEVAYWNPRVTTDAAGKATVKIVIPDSSTRWKLIARGVTPETLVGRGEAEALSRHDFFVELLPPAEVVEGDKFTPLARVHCLTKYEGDVEIELRANPKSKIQNPKSDATKPQTRTLKFTSSGVADVAFDALDVPDAENLVLEITAKTLADAPEAGRKLSDAATREVPIRPWGMRLETHAAGIRGDSDFVELELPRADGQHGPPARNGQDAHTTVHDARLTIAVGPSMQRWLIEEALESGRRWEKIEQFYRSSIACPPRSNADAASTLLGALYVGDYVRGSQEQRSRGATEKGTEGPRDQESEPRPEGRGPTSEPRPEGRGLGDKATPPPSGPLPAGRGSDAQSKIQNPKSKIDSPDDLRLLDDRAAGLVAQLLSVQNDDGGWPWAGKGKESDPWTTAHVAWALGKAMQSGHGVYEPALQKLRGYLNKAFADARTEQGEFKAVVLHGISWVETADFAHANRLYRNRQSLSNAGLAHLAMTFARLDRKSIAAEVLGVLDQKMKDAKTPAGATPRQAKCLSAENCSAWLNSELEITGMALLAQLSVDVRGANVRAMVEYLAASARHNGWNPHKARGAVLAALATFYANAPAETANYRLAVSVNGREVRKIAADEAGSVVVELDEAELQGVTGGKVRVDFKFEGRGEYAFAATLSAFSRTYPDPNKMKRDILRVTNRIVEQPTVEWKGKWVVPGWSVCSEYKTFRNIATALPVGGVTRVEVNPERYDRSENAAGDRDYVIVQETIPAGFRFVPGTLAGNFLSYDLSDNILTLYYGSTRHIGQVSYHMVATTPGTYRLAPTIIRSLYRPEIVHVNKSTETIAVLPRGEKTPDEYKLSPDQFYNLGKFNYDDGDYEVAAKLLKELIAGDWTLHADPYRESIRMLLGSALRRDDAEGIVNYFEILKEKYPELVIPFEDIVTVAAAYGRTGQHERATIVWRATADASFVRDAAIGGTLQGEGHFLDSIDFMEDLWREYPDTPQAESIYYALSQSIYAKAGAPADVRQRRGGGGAGKSKPPATIAGEKITKNQLVRETIRILERFLTLHPQSPAADEASYSLANAYLDLDDFQTVLDRSAKMIELFPRSKWVDRFKYLRSLAYFNLGQFDQARKLADEVAVSTYRDEQGVERPSPNKWLALYIIGQIYHAQGRTAEAIDYYKKVREQFSDAHEAVDFFEHRFVGLPEVTIFHPDQGGFRESEEWERAIKAGGLGAASEMRFGVPAAASATPRNTPAAAPPPDARRDTGRTLLSQANLPATLYSAPFVRLDFRNVKSAVLQVYRVDLMKLALMEKNLSQITSVNLAGVKPILETTVELGDGLDYQDRSLRVELGAILTAMSAGGAKSGANVAAGAGGARSDAANSAAQSKIQNPKSKIADQPAGAVGRPDAAGAYLVICRADDLLSSGLVLVTPLAVDVQEDLVSQRTRVNVVDAISRAGVKNVHVKVIGTGMNRFVAGESDLRGVYLADGVSGYPTAIARDAAGSFAFYRSEGAVLAMSAAAGTPPSQAVYMDQSAEGKTKAGGFAGGAKGGKAEYRKNLDFDNRAIQASNDARLQECYKTDQKGVQVQRAQ